MKILPITLLNTHKQSFGEKDSRSDLNRQVKQLMRENFADMQNSIIENARKQTNNEFKDKFEKEIKKSQNIPIQQDTKLILNELKTAYRNAALQWDVDAIDRYLNEKGL